MGITCSTTPDVVPKDQLAPLLINASSKVHRMVNHLDCGNISSSARLAVLCDNLLIVSLLTPAIRQT